MKDYLKTHVLKLTFLINMLFLLWHAVLLAVFRYEEIWIMTCFNVFSVLVYIHTLLALRKHRTRGVIQMMYVELLFHMIISVTCMGWECGFQEYAFGILPIVILGDYIEDNSKLRFRSFAMAGSVAVSYLLLDIWSNTHVPLYLFKSPEGTRLFGIINGTATILAVCLYYLAFTHIVLGFERGLIHDASYDSLTGLANRRVLEMIGELLTECRYKMKKFLPVRWGGEEFVVVYYDADIDREEKIRQVEDIRRRIGELRVTVDEAEIGFTATIGAAAAGEDETLDGLVALADSRMYYGKGHGKDCLVFSHDEWRRI